MAKVNGDVLVEFAGKQNQYFMVKFLKERIRGRWTVAHEKESSRRTGARNMPDIPGIRVIVNKAMREIRAYDPLGTPEFRETLDRANDIREPYFGRGRPADDLVIRNATQDDIKTALWELREFIDADKAFIVSGTMPSKKAILGMDGSIRVRYGTLPVANDGTTLTPYATPEELERMGGEPEGSRVTTEPYQQK